MLVTDAGSGQLHELAADGSLWRSVGAIGEFSFANGVAVAPDGTLYVADSNNGRIVVFNATGAQVAVVGRGPGDGDVSLPRGMAT